MDWGAIFQAAAPALIQAGSGLIGGLSKPDYTQQQLDQNSQQFAATQALDREKLAQALQIAQMNASAAGAGSGAAVAAARIKAATDEKAIKQQALQALMEGRLKQSQLMDPTVVSNANQALAGEQRTTGQTALSAFNALADRLQAPLLRR